MSTADRSNDKFGSTPLLDSSRMRFAIIVSEWNHEITESLYEACYRTLTDSGCSPSNIVRKNVPGTFELPLAAKWMLETGTLDAVICLGCVIQGETRHFDFICDSTANAIMNLGLESGIPVIFGVLTPNNMQQAKDRAGGKYGNKGTEAAEAAIKMAALRKEKMNNSK